jgi:hypothetical protein
MRIVLLVLAVAAVALLALPSSPVSLGAPTPAFAAEATPVVDIEPINPYCSRYCFGSAGHQYCSTSPGDRNGCHHINSLGNCIFTLCGITPVPDPEVQ